MVTNKEKKKKFRKDNHRTKRKEEVLTETGFRKQGEARPEKEENQNSKSSVRRNSGRVTGCKNSSEEEVPGLRIQRSLDFNSFESVENLFFDVLNCFMFQTSERISHCRLQSNMRILVTGGAGFIGSHLVDRLMGNDKNEVIVADNYFTGSKDNLRKWIGHPRFELIRHDVTEPLLVEVDQIYHLACPASPIFYKYNPVKTIKTNVIGTLNMLGLAKRVGARILLTSTSEVYGDPLVHPQDESYWGNVNPIGVRSCYDEGKRVAETLMFDYHRQHGIEIRIARIFNTYGPRMNIDDGRVVSNFIAQALRYYPLLPSAFNGTAIVDASASALHPCSGEPLTVQAPGTQTRSFCYVSDMVDGLIRLMEGEHTGPINIGNPGEFTMQELAETVKELIDHEVTIVSVENTPDDPRQRKPDITKAKELLGWEPTIKLRDGLPLMEEDFRQRLGIPKK
ncbi:hypothetical protein HHK36_018392 [Tetracentron sinense]|uniref:UDP-glucuronate decarboxylase n=1 Tax=Tetracentron sinense TaxID=13715 RepID=A0A834Z1E1_TETSI|nr:hypothetical protein HHK36_018392 [Tetracentron sinense]